MEKVDPIIQNLQKRIVEIEGGKTATLLTSGKEAVFQTILALAHAGDEIVVCENLRPEIYDLFNVLIRDMGITVNFVQSSKAKDYVAAISLRTRCIFIDIEGGSFPQAFEVEEIGYIAHKNKIPFVVEASGISPFFMKPIEFGADIVVRDLSVLCGTDMCTGGSVTEAGVFDWRISNVPLIKAGDPSCNNIRWAFDLPKEESACAFSMRLRHVVMRILDSKLNYSNAFLIYKVIGDTALYFTRRCENAMALAKLFGKSKEIAWVAYPTVTETSSAVKAYGKVFGSSVAFAFKGSKEESREKAIHFLGELKTILVNEAVNSKHSSMYFADVKKEEKIIYTRPSLSIEKENTIHFFAGIEDFKDIKKDIAQALKKI